MVNAGFNSRGFFFNESGLQYNGTSSGSGGWLGWLGTSQPFSYDLQCKSNSIFSQLSYTTDIAIAV